MVTGNLRKVGGSVMVAIPRQILELVNLDTDAAVTIDVKDEQIILKPARPAYTLQELLAQCDGSVPMSDDETMWLNDAAQGEEML